MSLISLAKALKLKNRLVSRLSTVQNDIQEANSVIKEQENSVDIAGLFNTKNALTEELLALKVAIILANAPIQKLIIGQGEIKAEITFLKTVPTRSGIERSAYSREGSEIVYVAYMDKKTLDATVRGLEKKLDENQDAIDKFNYTNTIDVPQRALDLAS